MRGVKAPDGTVHPGARPLLDMDNVEQMRRLLTSAAALRISLGLAYWRQEALGIEPEQPLELGVGTWDGETLLAQMQASMAVGW